MSAAFQNSSLSVTACRRALLAFRHGVGDAFGGLAFAVTAPMLLAGVLSLVFAVRAFPAPDPAAQVATGAADLLLFHAPLYDSDFAALLTPRVDPASPCGIVVTALGRAESDGHRPLLGQWRYGLCAPISAETALITAAPASRPVVLIQVAAGQHGEAGATVVAMPERPASTLIRKGSRYR